MKPEKEFANEHILFYNITRPTYCNTHSLHAAGVLLEKLNGLQLVKKSPAFYGTPRFIIAFTSARHLSLS